MIRDTKSSSNVDLDEQVIFDTSSAVSPSDDGQVILNELEYLELKKAAHHSNYISTISFFRRSKAENLEKLADSRGYLAFYLVLLTFLIATFASAMFELFTNINMLTFDNFWDYALIFTNSLLFVFIIVLVVLIVLLCRSHSDYKYNIEFYEHLIDKKYETFTSNPEYNQIIARIDELKNNKTKPS